MAKGNLERFYSLREVGEKIGRKASSRSDFGKEMAGENPYGVETYRWARGGGSKVYVKQSDANKILEAHGVPAIDDDPPQRREFYGLYEVSDIIGLNAMSVYNLAQNRGVNEREQLPMIQRAELRFATKTLVNWFGMAKIRKAGLDKGLMHTIMEVSKALRVSREKVLELVEAGELEPVNRDSHMANRLSISHDELVDWIESRRGAFDADKVGNTKIKQEVVS